MSVFADYALYYNLLYQAKDYREECTFVLDTLKGTLQRHPDSILDLGCGTGLHAAAFAEQGIAVTGVDISETMLSVGRQPPAAAGSGASLPPPELVHGDIRSVRLGKTFEAAVSLFHVMSYQTTEQDLLQAMETAFVHLKPGGLFLFDFWHGPGVLRELPEERSRRMENAELKLERHAAPELHPHDDRVDIFYEIAVTDKASGRTEHMKEVHSMRYWFMPELRHHAKQSGFSVLSGGAWMSHLPAGLDDWYAWMLLRK